MRQRLRLEQMTSGPHAVGQDGLAARQPLVETHQRQRRGLDWAGEIGDQSAKGRLGEGVSGCVHNG